MTKRREFSKAIRVAVIKRATIEGVTRCEECHGVALRLEIDHVNPDGLTGEPTLDNALLLCRSCHVEKTSSDVAHIAQAKRREARHLGAHRPKAKIPQKPKQPKPEPRAMPPRRSLYRETPR